MDITESKKLPVLGIDGGIGGGGKVDVVIICV
jgi:hypothetical protein